MWLRGTQLVLIPERSEVMMKEEGKKDQLTEMSSVLMESLRGYSSGREQAIRIASAWMLPVLVLAQSWHWCIRLSSIPMHTSDVTEQFADIYMKRQKAIWGKRLELSNHHESTFYHYSLSFSNQWSNAAVSIIELRVKRTP